MVVAVSFTKRLPPSAVGRGTLAELMAKQKAAADTRNAYASEGQSPTIMQGIGNLANIGLQGFKEGRADRDLGIQQARQRELIGQIDPMTGATQDQIAAMGEFDPKLMEQLFSDRAAKLRADAERDNWQPLTPAEYEQFHLDPAGGYVRNITTGDIKSLVKSDGININTGEKGSDEWAKKRAANFAEQVAADAREGVASGSRLGQLAILEKLNPQMLTGTSAMIAQYAKKNWGLELGEKADATTMFTAIIDGMTPKERTEGSGSMSNFDAEMLKRSLPDILNSPGGNLKIINYLRGIATYNQQMGKIAQETLGIDDPNAARKYYYEKASALANPLANLAKDLEGLPQTAAVPAPAATGNPAVDFGAAAGANAAGGGPPVAGVGGEDEGDRLIRKWTTKPTP